MCEYKGVEIVEAHACSDHIHMLVKIPPKLSVSSFMGYLKGKREYLESKKEELLNQLDDIEYALTDLDYREANQRAGYVYIISNIGAFGENIYKIGMTRRLDPNDRIVELSGASVPFKFDIHAMIFSDDAPKLEAELHNHFADKKVNLVNSRKEFFNVSLEEIKQVVCQYHDKSVDFVEVPDAEQYRKSLMMKK